jgi:ABC-type multidrug transport system permease subunit
VCSLRTMAAILCKDLEDAVRSHSLVLVLVGPVLLSVFFARSFTGEDVRRPAMVVCDAGRSGLVQALHSSGLFRLQESGNWEDCIERVRKGQVTAALQIPAGFDLLLRQDRFPRVDLVLDENARTQVAIVREGLRGALRQQAGQEMPADVRVTGLNRFQGEVRQILLPIWVVFTCLGGLMVTSSTLVEEMEKKTLAAVLLAPVSLSTVLLGKLGAGFLLALASSALVLVLNAWGQGNLVALGVLLALGSLVFSAAGLVLGLCARGQAAASAAASVLYMVLFVPVALADLSATMRAVSEWLPTWYLYDGINRALLSGASLDSLRLDLAGLMASLLMLFPLGLWGLRRQRVGV